MAAVLKAVVVGVDTYRWVDENGDIQSADRGEEVFVSAKEFERIEGALSKPGSKDAKAASADEPSE